MPRPPQGSAPSPVSSNTTPTTADGALSGAAERHHAAWSGRRLSLRDALAQGGGLVAGRYWHAEPLDVFEDASGAAEIQRAAPRPGHGDQVSGVLLTGAVTRLETVEVLAPARRELPRELRRAASRRRALETRARVLDAVRRTFVADGFLEVETPVRVVNPGLEPHLSPFVAGAARDGAPRFLRTSPELHLKRLLAAGYERVFEVARCFRDDEAGRLHVSEPTLLEWYRTHAGLDALAADVTRLLRATAAATGGDPATLVPGCDLSREPRRRTFRAVFAEHARHDPHALEPTARDRAFVDLVEPRLGFGEPLLVTEYPADSCALARLAPSSETPGRLVAQRMELYIAGVELANGFDELTDPAEQRRRHESDRAARAAAGLVVSPLDEGFLAALESGCPPAAGMALGIDRLVMLLAGCRDIADVLPFGGD